MGSLGFLACASQEYPAWPALVFASCIKPVVITHSTQDTLVSVNWVKNDCSLTENSLSVLVPQSAAAERHFPLITQAND